MKDGTVRTSCSPLMLQTLLGSWWPGPSHATLASYYGEGLSCTCPTVVPWGHRMASYGPQASYVHPTRRMTLTRRPMPSYLQLACLLGVHMPSVTCNVDSMALSLAQKQSAKVLSCPPQHPHQAQQFTGERHPITARHHDKLTTYTCISPARWCPCSITSLVSTLRRLTAYPSFTNMLRPVPGAHQWAARRSSVSESPSGGGRR